jgi:LAO/AO transport system kinase
MLVAAPRAGAAAADRPRPKQPEVLVTTAATGDGVPELLAALDRHRLATTTDGGDGARRARLARAEAQVWAIVSDRLRDRLHDDRLAEAAAGTLAAVAEHRLDPYAAADDLLGLLTDVSETGGDRPSERRP